jgi:hypothetical protein
MPVTIGRGWQKRRVVWTGRVVVLIGSAWIVKRNLDASAGRTD